MSERHGARDAEPELDLAVVRSDDEALDALGRGLPATDADAALQLLATWRSELVAEPVPERPGVDAAQVALRRGVASASPWRGRMLRVAPAAAAAAAVLVLLGGVGYATLESGPGDPLWGLSQAVFVDHSRSVQAAAEVDSALARAELALDSGRPAAASSALAEAERRLADVDDRQVREVLETRRTQVQAQLDTMRQDVAPPSRTATPGTTAPATPGSSAAPPARSSQDGVPPTTAGRPSPPSSGPATSGPPSSGPATSSPPSSGPATSSPATSSPAPTSSTGPTATSVSPTSPPSSRTASPEPGASATESPRRGVITSPPAPSPGPAG